MEYFDPAKDGAFWAAAGDLFALAVAFCSGIFYLLALYGDILRWIASKSMPLAFFVAINFLVILAPDVIRLTDSPPAPVRDLVLDLSLGLAINTGLVLIFLLMRAAFSWAEKLQDRGRWAFRAGNHEEANPYASAPGRLGRLRSRLWRKGYDQARLGDHS